jgi:Spy/CpxP family protein refolding chaperone
MRGARKVVRVLVLAALALPAVPALAQEPPRRGPQDRAAMEARVREQMARIVKERLELSDEEAQELSQVVQRFEGRRRELGRSEMATRRRVEALVLEGGTDDDEAVELLERMVELRRQEAALFEEEQEALLEVLPAAKVLQLQALREEMGRRIRSLRRGEGRRRPGPPGAFEPGNVDWLLGVTLPS